MTEEKKKVGRPRTKDPKEKKVYGYTQDEAARIARRKRHEPLFQTKTVDYSNLRTVRIDDRTVVYAKPGEDPDDVRERYLKQRAKAKRLAGGATAF